MMFSTATYILKICTRWNERTTLQSKLVYIRHFQDYVKQMTAFFKSFRILRLYFNIYKLFFSLNRHLRSRANMYVSYIFYFCCSIVLKRAEEFWRKNLKIEICFLCGLAKSVTVKFGFFYDLE